MLVFTFMEIWKPIKDYEGIYEISNLGRVKSLIRLKKGAKEISLKYNIKMNCISEVASRRNWKHIEI